MLVPRSKQVGVCIQTTRDHGRLNRQRRGRSGNERRAFGDRSYRQYNQRDPCTRPSVCSVTISRSSLCGSCQLSYACPEIISTYSIRHLTTNVPFVGCDLSSPRSCGDSDQWSRSCSSKGCGNSAVGSTLAPWPTRRTLGPTCHECPAEPQACEQFAPGKRPRPAWAAIGVSPSPRERVPIPASEGFHRL